MTNNWYWAFKNVLLGPFLRVYNRPTIDGGSNIPTIGAAILASNHQSVMDSFYLPLLCPRQITFPAKSEYFTTPGIVGRLQNGSTPRLVRFRLTGVLPRPVRYCSPPPGIFWTEGSFSAFTPRAPARPTAGFIEARPGPPAWLLLPMCRSFPLP